MKSFTSTLSLKRISLFSFVGILNTSVDVLIVNIMLVLLSSTIANPFMFSRACGFIGAMAVSYVLNKRVVFTQKETDKTAPLRFAIVTCISFVVGMAASLATFNLLLELLNLHVKASIATLVGSCVGAVINFIGYSTYVFRSYSRY